MTTNLPALRDIHPTLIADEVTPTVEPDGYGGVIVTLGPVKAHVYYQIVDPLEWSYISVDNDLAEAVDPALAGLAEAERNLGDDRWLDRGIDPDVDALYDRLNARIAEVETTIASTVLPYLTCVLDDKADWMLRDLEFSAYAGCTSCRCSAGVKAPKVYRYGGRVQIDISRA